MADVEWLHGQIRNRDELMFSHIAFTNSQIFLLLFIDKYVLYIDIAASFLDMEGETL